MNSYITIAEANRLEKRIKDLTKRIDDLIYEFKLGNNGEEPDQEYNEDWREER